MKNVIIIISTVFLFQNCWSQKIEEITHREINVHFNDSSIKANVLLADKKPRLKNTSDYYWYYNNSIKSNQGDYKGRLLDGGYQVTSKNGSLITKGSFKKGNKWGIWKQWNIQGKLVYIENWSKGAKNGSYQKFNNGELIEKGFFKKDKLNGAYQKFENEKLIEKGNYKKGLLHGKQLKYNSDTISSDVNFKKGKEVIKKDKKQKESKEPKLDKEHKKSKDQTGKKWWQIWKNKDNSSKPMGKGRSDGETEDNESKNQKKMKSKKRKEKEKRGKQESKKDD